MRTIATIVDNINERNTTSASAAEEQSTVAQEVDHNLVNLRELAQQTATGTDQTRTASQDLVKLASELKGLVAQFNL
ncbi:MAG: methyl-accepting chemotaxis protein [Natronospirillum sp.]